MNETTLNSYLTFFKWRAKSWAVLIYYSFILYKPIKVIKKKSTELRDSDFCFNIYSAEHLLEILLNIRNMIALLLISVYCLLNIK